MSSTKRLRIFSTESRGQRMGQHNPPYDKVKSIEPVVMMTGSKYFAKMTEAIAKLFIRWKET